MGQRKKYYLVRWIKICRTKKKGGLGVKDLRHMNLSLLCRWWWKLEKDDGIWQTIAKQKYVKNSTIAQLRRNPSNSPVWNDLLKVKDLYMNGRVMMVGRGDTTDFCHDAWCGSLPLKEKYPDLYEICNDQKVTVAMMAQRNWRMTFRRWLDEPLQDRLRRMRDIISSFALSDGKDFPKWIFGESWLFLCQINVCPVWGWKCRKTIQTHMESKNSPKD
jgi:hypothetical protein